MSNRRTLLLIALSLAVLAGGLRFFRLGDWPFHGDELPTLHETASYYGESDEPATSQIARLPKVIPLSYVVHHAGYELFGRDEFGSRVMLALLGTLQVVVVFLCLDRPLGRAAALATALLLALWPEHIYRSQENRFYVISSVCSSLCMLIGSQAVYRRSLTLAALACVAALGAMLALTTQALVLGGLFAGILAAAWLSRDRRIARLLAVVFAGGAVTAGVFFFYVLPLVRGWNTGEEWGYSGLHSILSGVSQLGWPVALLVLLGTVGALKRRGEQDGYWLAWGGLWLAAIVALPLVITYHPGYVFPLTLGAFVLAGRAVAQVYEGLRAQSTLAAGAWVGLAALMNLPGVASHYVDGTRFDFRTSAQYVSSHWQPGDRVAVPSATLLKYYLADGIEPTPVKGTDPLPRLKMLVQQPGRLWIVFPSTRGGKPEALRAWLAANCSQRLLLCKKRFDYYENTTEVFLYEPPEPAPRWAQGFADRGQ